jgi:transposase
VANSAAEARLDALGKADHRARLLDTVRGLGPRTAEAVVAHLDDPRRCNSGRQVAAYGGLVPRQHQSGEDDRRGPVASARSFMRPGRVCRRRVAERMGGAADTG